ncbi:MAG: hypothetical protein EB127_00005 [Alphaproteobacteria bacterium]|nr:hypothetical protein [Alphaproteobacteria bacterium]
MEKKKMIEGRNFHHDCQSCMFVGSKESATRKFDVFVCGTGEFVARYGNNPGDYVSSDDLVDVMKSMSR